VPSPGSAADRAWATAGMRRQGAYLTAPPEGEGPSATTRSIRSMSARCMLTRELAEQRPAASPAAPPAPGRGQAPIAIGPCRRDPPSPPEGPFPPAPPPESRMARGHHGQPLKVGFHHATVTPPVPPSGPSASAAGSTPAAHPVGDLLQCCSPGKPCASNPQGQRSSGLLHSRGAPPLPPSPSRRPAGTPCAWAKAPVDQADFACAR